MAPGAHHLQSARMAPHGMIQLSEAATEPAVFEAPAAVLHRQPSPVLQPREVIATMMSVLHRSSWDEPRPYFGFEVATRFLSPTHQVSGATPRDYARYLRQAHKVKLIEWSEYKWDGELTIIDKEAFQQVSVRSGPDGPWTSVRWLLVRVDAGDTPHSCWMVDAVFVEEPDVQEDIANSEPEECLPLDDAEIRQAFEFFDADKSGCISKDELTLATARLGIARSDQELVEVLTEVDVDASGTIDLEEFTELLKRVNSECRVGKFSAAVTEKVRSDVETPTAVVDKVMRALRNPDEPYPLHGAQVAIRYCSPTNRASKVSPSTFASYLKEPWYEILTEWDTLEIDEDVDEEASEASECTVDVLVKREEDDSPTVVCWELSRHSGRWLTDSLTIN